jgi:DNA-binding GntR family transcriptional regulator
MAVSSMHSADLTHKIDVFRNTGEQIAGTLKKMIYEGKFRPGEALRQDAIAELFGVSRVPVRDALCKLVAMQLALNVPRKGIVVHPLSRNLLKELFEVRVILEGAAVEHVIRNSDSALIGTLKEILHEQKMAFESTDVKANEKLDSRFHRSIREYSSNQTLNELIEANWMRIKQARCASSMVLPETGEAWMKKSIERHERLISAFETQNPLTARRVITKNIKESFAEVISTLERMGWLEDDKSITIEKN